MEKHATGAIPARSAQGALLRRPARLIRPPPLRLLDLALLHLHLPVGLQIRPHRLLRKRAAVDGDPPLAAHHRLRHPLHHKHLRPAHRPAHEVVSPRQQELGHQQPPLLGRARHPLRVHLHGRQHLHRPRHPRPPPVRPDEPEPGAAGADDGHQHDEGRVERVRPRHRHRGPEHRRRARQVGHAEARGERAQGEHHAHHRRVGARRDRREPARRLPAQPTLLRQEIAEGRVLPPEGGQQRAIVGDADFPSERV